MSNSLASFQSSFVKSLFDQDAESTLTTQPAFAVYRNTVMSGCVDALQANFPSVARLVGVDWFRAAAATYARAQPPRDGRLLMYGETFADFLADFEPAHDLPYLAGVARLDRLWIEAHTAEDAMAVDSAWLASLLPDQLGALRLRPHPATRWRFFDGLPIYSIWAPNRVGTDAMDDIVWQGEGALLTRPVDAVGWQALDRPSGAFLDACAEGRLLAEAAGSALDVLPDVDADLERKETCMNHSTTLSTTAVRGGGFRTYWNAVAGSLSRWIGHDVLSLASRISIAAIFFLSGRTKVDGFLNITDGAYELFRSEYKLPLIQPEIAAHLATYAEHLFPVLLVLGLFTRLSALALLGMTVTIQVFVYPDAWPTHLSWAALLLYLIGRGAGTLSFDKFLKLA